MSCELREREDQKKNKKEKSIGGNIIAGRNSIFFYLYIFYKTILRAILHHAQAQMDVFALTLPAPSLQFKMSPVRAKLAMVAPFAQVITFSLHLLLFSFY